MISKPQHYCTGIRWCKHTLEWLPTLFKQHSRASTSLRLTAIGNQSSLDRPSISQIRTFSRLTSPAPASITLRSRVCGQALACRCSCLVSSGLCDRALDDLPLWNVQIVSEMRRMHILARSGVVTRCTRHVASFGHRSTDVAAQVTLTAQRLMSGRCERASCRLRLHLPGIC